MKGAKSFMGILGLLALFVLFPCSAQAEPVGKFTYIEGRVDITSPGQQARPAHVGDEISVGDIVRSKSKSKAEIAFHDGNILRLAQSTRVKISEYELGEEESSRILRLFRGKVQSIVNRVLNKIFGRNKKYIFEVHTPSAVCGVRGTNFFTWYEWGGTYVAFKEGKGYVFPLNREDLMTFINRGEGARVVGPDQPLEKYPLSDERLEELEKDTATGNITGEDEEGNKQKKQETGKENPRATKMASVGDGNEHPLSPDEIGPNHGAVAGLEGTDQHIWTNHLTDEGLLTIDSLTLVETALLGDGQEGKLSGSGEMTHTPTSAEDEILPILYKGVGWRHGSFDGWGSITVKTSEGYEISYKDQNWGIWEFEVNGDYCKCTSSDEWSLHLRNSATDPEIHRWAEVAGSEWSGGTTAGKVAGAWVNLEDAITGVSGGELKGNYNPTERTWQALAEGSWMETKRFLQMAATSYDSASDTYTFNKTETALSDTQKKLLDTHNIPCIEIGRTDLTGSRDFKGGSISVTMHDVTFFAYSTGAAPRIWATDKVSGNYTGSPQQGWEVYDLQAVNRQNVRHLHAHFVLEKWDKGEGKWSANIDHGRAKVGGHSVTFDGGAAGTIDSANDFSGTGAGVVRPQ